MDARQPGKRAGNAQGILLIVGSALPIMGVVLLTPVALKMEQAIDAMPGGSAALGAMALTAPALAIAFLSPLTGWLVDRVERRLLLILSLIVYAIVGPLPYWLENPYAIIGARFMLGAAEAIIISAKFTILADYYEKAELDRWIAYGGAATAVAATFFYISGGVLGEISWKAPFLAYLIGFPIALLVAWLIFEPARRTVQPAAIAAEGEPAAGVYAGIAAIMVMSLIGSMLFYIVPLQLGRFLAARDVTSPAEIGVLIAVAGIGNPIGAFVFRYLRSVPMSILLGGSFVVAGAGLAMAAPVSAPMALVVGAFVNQVGCGLFIPVMIAALIRQSPPERLGVISGVRQSIFFIGQFCSPLIVLQVMQVGNVSEALLLLAMMNVGFGLLFWAWFRFSSLNRTTMAT